jgi:hypothetical protein
MNVGGGACPPAGSSPAPTAPSLQNLLALARHYRDLGLIPPPDSRTTASPATAQREPSGRERGVARGERVHEAEMEASSVAKITGDRQGDSSAGRRAPVEPLPAISTLPSEAALLELALQMLTGGSGEPAAPAEHYEPAEASLELLVRVWSVVATLKKQHGSTSSRLGRGSSPRRADPPRIASDPGRAGALCHNLGKQRCDGRRSLRQAVRRAERTSGASPRHCPRRQSPRPACCRRPRCPLPAPSPFSLPTIRALAVLASRVAVCAAVAPQRRRSAVAVGHHRDSVSSPLPALPQAARALSRGKPARAWLAQLVQHARACAGRSARRCGAPVAPTAAERRPCAA